MDLPYIDQEETGQNIKHLIKEKGLTVKELRKILGFSTDNAIYKWIHGECMPSLDSLVILSWIFGMPIDEIIVVKGE